MEDTIQFQPRGICCRFIVVRVKDGLIEDVDFFGGCQGNQTGLKALVKGMKIGDVISRLQGIDCGGKGTSCPDQLALCLKQYQNKKI